MSFSQKLAGKYMLSQKRHSVFTLLSITAAVLFITVMMTLFASYWDTAKNAYREKFPWHATIYNISAEEAEALKSNEFIAELEYVEWDNQSDAYILFTKDIHDPATLIRNIFGSDSNVRYSLNYNLMNYELIGIHAKSQFVTTLSTVYIFILVFVISARFIIDTAFEISSKERQTQFGILASLGASRKQIVRIILWEGIMLSLIAIPVGILIGIGISRIIFDAVISSDILYSFLAVGKSAAVFSAPLPLMLSAAVMALIWVMLSAYGTGMRFAKKPPVEVIRQSGEKIKKVKKSRVLGRLFGITGTLASRNVRRNKKRFAITVISITLSFALTAVTMSLTDYFDRTVKHSMQINETLHPSYHYIVQYCPDNYKGLSLYDMNYTAEDIKRGYELIKGSEQFTLVQLDADIMCKIDKDELAVNDSFSEYDSIYLDIKYYNEEYYNYVFDGKPPVPYSALRGGNYIVVSTADECPVDYRTDGSFTCAISQIVREKSVTESELAQAVEIGFDEDGSKLYKISTEYSGNIIAAGKPVTINSVTAGSIVLIGCEEEFAGITAAANHNNISCGKYYAMIGETGIDEMLAADILVNQYISETDELDLIFSNIDSIINTARATAALSILSIALIVLITIIALINEINIISTGILNRRREIASMRALGMSSGQLIKMSLLECGLYSVTSALVTIPICELLTLWINSTMITGQEAGYPILSYITPIASVLLVLIPVLAAAVITTLASLHGFGRNSISEEMRAVE